MAYYNHERSYRGIDGLLSTSVSAIPGCGRRPLAVALAATAVALENVDCEYASKEPSLGLRGIMELNFQICYVRSTIRNLPVFVPVRLAAPTDGQVTPHSSVSGFCKLHEPLRLSHSKERLHFRKSVPQRWRAHRLEGRGRKTSSYNRGSNRSMDSRIGCHCDREPQARSSMNSTPTS